MIQYENWGSQTFAFEIKCMLAIHLKNITFFYFQFATFATEIRGLEVVSPSDHFLWTTCDVFL